MADRPQSILLNHNAPRPQFTLTPPPGDHRSGPDRRGSSSSSFSSSSTSSEAGRTNSRQPSPPNSVGRKIKFAPLPDPRKLEEEEEAADSSSVTTVDDEDSAFPKSPLKVALDVLPLPALSPSDRTISLASSPKTWSSKLLGPLLSKNTTQSSVDFNPLYRTSSLESVQSTRSTASTRSRSRFSFGSWKPSGVQMHRTSSLQPSIGSPSPLGPTPSKSRRASISASSRGEPKPMLNGRVYGRKRGALTPDPFQNQRPAHEPEFVEWGYGGMGSVPNPKASGHTPESGAAAADWAKLQRGPVYDEDDGSGLGWVRRRREQREQREREQKEKEAAEAAAASAQASTDAPTPAEETTDRAAEGMTENSEEEPPGVVSPDRPAPRSHAGLAEDEHWTAVTVPAPVHYHITPLRRQSRDDEGSATVTPTLTLSRASSPEPMEDTSSSSVRDEDDDDEDEDEEELALQAEMKRKTASCAGVEKISRHREHATTAE